MKQEARRTGLLRRGQSQGARHFRAGNEAIMYDEQT